MRKVAAITTLLAAGQSLTPTEARDRHLRRTPPAAEAGGDSSARRQGHRRRRKGADLRKRRASIIGEEDITEDVGFFTRMLQAGSLPLTPRPTPFPSLPPITPFPIGPNPETPAPVGPNPETPAPVEPETLAPSPFPITFAPSPAPTTNQPTIEPSDSPTFPCNLTPDQRAADIRALMSTVTDPVLFDDPSTPQAQALDWITNEDAIEPVLCPDVSFCGMVQRYILAAFYYATEGGDWSQCSAPADLDDPASVAAANAQCNRVVTPFGVANERVGDTSTDAWLGPVNECQWGGVACWGSDTPNLELCIDQLDFENDGLSGTLISEVGELDSLRFLILEQGSIEGQIPPEIGDLQRLLILDMDFNQLTGTIPDEIYGLSSLQQLDLNDNQISGVISSSIENLRLLTFLQLDHNEFSSTIPSEMGTLQNLRIAFLSANDLTGEMPEEVCANRNNTVPPGVLGVLVTDCAGPDPEVECACCSSCA